MSIRKLTIHFDPETPSAELENILNQQPAPAAAPEPRLRAHQSLKIHWPDTLENVLTKFILVGPHQIVLDYLGGTPESVVDARSLLDYLQMVLKQARQKSPDKSWIELVNECGIPSLFADSMRPAKSGDLVAEEASDLNVVHHGVLVRVLSHIDPKWNESGAVNFFDALDDDTYSRPGEWSVPWTAEDLRAIPLE